MIRKSFCLLLMGMVFSSCGGASRKLEAPRVVKQEVDSEWDHVLQLAKSRNELAKKELQTISRRSDKAPSTKLAQVILEKWNDDQNTFFLDEPIPVIDQNWSNVFWEVPAGLYEVWFTVDQRGVVKKVKVQSSSEDQKVTKIVEQAALNVLFCPAKDGDNYIQSNSYRGMLSDAF